MAKPRVFVSSTYFDLRIVRADLERFIREMGYDPILFERGHIPYGKEDALEEYCYREIDTCDILVAVIGGKYGSQSSDNINSITQRELKTAYELGKQVYIFIERHVHGEYPTYLKNKDVADFKPSSVDNKRIFEFLEEIYALTAGNPITAFDTSEDITKFLKAQFGGLFQRLLQESARQKEVRIIENLKNTASTLNQLVTFLTEERAKGDEAIKDILLLSHPAFASIKEIASIPYRVVFQTLDELRALLEVRGFRQDAAPWLEEEVYDFDNIKAGYGIRVKKAIFDDSERLIIITPDKWDEMSVTRYPLTRKEDNDDDDDIPF